MDKNLRKRQYILDKGENRRASGDKKETDAIEKEDKHFRNRIFLPDGGDSKVKQRLIYDYKTVNYRKPVVEVKKNQTKPNMEKVDIPVRALKNFLSISQNRNERDLEKRKEELKNKVMGDASDAHKAKAFKKSDSKDVLDPLSTKLFPKPTVTKEKTADEYKNATKINESEEKDSKTSKRPIIKTLTTKMDTLKVYKSVAFVEDKQATIIQIKIPNTYLKNRKSSRSSLMTTKSKNEGEETKDKSVNTKRRTKHRRFGKEKSISSPMFRVNNEGETPKTEVAKWAPSCLNSHTKPYYEAWINTTLAAVSRSAKNDQLLMKKIDILQSFKNSIDSVDSQDMIYDNNNERYTGKIRVKQR